MRQLLAGRRPASLSALHELLQQQFQAALRHKASELGPVAEAISTLVDTMQARRARAWRWYNAWWGRKAPCCKLLPC
jgi:flagella synthesis protein FlgN